VTATPAPGRTGGDRPKPPWYRRRATVVAGLIAVIVAVTVVTDLPQHASVASQIAGGTSVMKQVNADVGPCAFALNETFEIYRDEKRHSLTASEQSRVPALLRDDQAACSFTDNSIFDLSNVEVPGSAAGKHLGQVVSITTLWATSDALAAIEAVQTMQDDPTNHAALSELAKEERLLNQDRTHADGELTAANHTLGARLPVLQLPAAPKA
jgi:hypothetical protein